MRRSLTIIMAMGLIGLVMIAAMGSFFVGKVGGAEHVADLRSELAQVYGFQMENPDDLRVTVKTRDGESGLLVAFRPSAALLRKPRLLESQTDRLGQYILSLDQWRKRISFVLFELEMPNGKVRERRIERKTAPLSMK
jgi:hypothetical protein